MTTAVVPLTVEALAAHPDFPKPALYRALLARVGKVRADRLWYEASLTLELPDTPQALARHPWIGNPGHRDGEGRSLIDALCAKYGGERGGQLWVEAVRLFDAATTPRPTAQVPRLRLVCGGRS